MKTKTTGSTSRHPTLFGRPIRTVMMHNPLAYQGLAVASVAAAGYTLKNAAVLSIVMAMVTLPTMLIASLIRNLTTGRMRAPVSVLTALVFYIPAYQTATALMPGTPEKLGLYLPIILVNTLLLTRTGQLEATSGTKAVLLDTSLDILSYALTVCFCGVVREVLGLGTLWGISLKLPLTFPGAQTIGFGLILLGLIAALWRAVERMLERRSVRMGGRFHRRMQDRSLYPEALSADEEGTK